MLDAGYLILDSSCAHIKRICDEELGEQRIKNFGTLCSDVLQNRNHEFLVPSFSTISIFLLTLYQLL